MSMKLMTQIWDNEDPDLTGSRLLILLCLADHANDDGVCWPSIARLTKRARIDRSGIIRHLDELEAAGYLVIERDPGRVNTYTVRATRRTSATGGADATGRTNATPTRRTSATPPVAPVRPESSVNHQVNHHDDDALINRADGKGQRPSSRTDAELGRVCTAFTTHLGQILTPYNGDMLWDWLTVDAYPADWIIDAFAEAAAGGADKMNLRYTGGILRRWKAEGRKNGHAPADPAARTVVAVPTADAFTALR